MPCGAAALTAQVNLKHTTPTIEQSADTLYHLTTATMLPLRGDISSSNLNCAEMVWKQSSTNAASGQLWPTITLEDLVSIHKEPTTPHPSGLQTRQQRFNAGRFLSDLVEYGPEHFRQFRGKLEEPEIVDAIPPEKTTQLPMRAMDVKPDTPAQNAKAVKEIFKQASFGDPAENPGIRNIANMVALIFGDLGTMQHLRSLMESQAEDTTPWNRLQSIVVVLGLFHLKMACADAIWKIFIDGGKLRRADPNSLINHVGEIRPKETGKIETKPSFRQMHEVIQHVGIVMQLDAWRVSAAKHLKKDLESLDDYAKLEPKWEDLVLISHDLCRNYVASKTDDLSRKRKQPTAQRDQQQENILLQMQYFLLYEQMSHALNYGDIGRVESLFVPWMSIFRGCGKHKYAAELRHYLENVHFIYCTILFNSSVTRHGPSKIDEMSRLSR
jgi:hypothetical protein